MEFEEDTAKPLSAPPATVKLEAVKAVAGTSDAVKVINELGHNQLISSPDWPYRWSPRVDFYQCVSPIFVHPPQGENSLIGERSNNREKILNRIPNPIRLFRALMFNIPFDVAFKKEISFKCKLLFRQLRYKIGAK